MTRRRLLLVAPFLLLAGHAAAEGHGRGNQGGGHGRGHGRGNSGQGHGQPAFASDTSTLVRGWKTANPDWAPQALPPGQMRQLARGRPLPPGLARQAVPPGLLSQLPVHPGHSYAMIGTSLVLLGSNNAVVDILGNLF